MASSPRKLISRKLAPPRGAPPEAAPGLSSPEVSADFAEWPSEEPAPGDAAAGDADSVPSELETVPSEADPASELLELDLSAGPGSTETLLREVPTLGRAIAASLVSLDLSGNSLGPKLEPRAHLLGLNHVVRHVVRNARASTRGSGVASERRGGPLGEQRPAASAPR